MAHLARITLFPVKSLDGQAVETAQLLPSGALAGDRRFALVDHEGRFVNAKRTEKLHPIRSAVDLEHLRLELEWKEEVATFDLREDRDEIEQYFSLLLHQRVRLIENLAQGFPDDTNASGPTIVSTATLELAATWFDGLNLEELRRRFRANLEIDGVEPFWEDQLFGGPNEEVTFRIGDAQLRGVNPCQRCVVPTRDTLTGEPWAGFQKRFAAERERHLPPWANRARFDHFYRLAVNTRAESEAPQTLAVGDRVEIGS